MFRQIDAKIIAPVPRDKRRAGRRLRFASYALFGALLLTRFSSASPSFDRSAFSKIKFSGSCNQKQWVLLPDNSLELLMSPSRNEACEADLEFYFPQEIADTPVLAFETRSSRPGYQMQVGVREQPGSDVVYTPPFPRGGLETEWQRDSLRLTHLKEDWAPKQIVSLHFVARPNPERNGSATLLIRRLRLKAPVAASAEEAAAPTAVTAASAALTLKEPAKPGLIRRSIRTTTSKILLSLAAILLFALTFGSRSRRRRILSPLYEINTRTWKTHRDANGVVQFGGFKKISLSDLKAVKQAGFNAIWLMGIWEIGPKVRDISKNYADDFHGSPFAIHDYAVSADLGSDQEFRELVQRAHTLRLSVLVDFIPNHMGLDSGWLNEHPEYFIHRVVGDAEAALGDEELKQRYPAHFPYRTPSYPLGNRRVPRTIMVAYGRDPYFYPWIDTAQLDYAHPGLRARMIETLCKLAKIVDGVRCDMAMLVLREQVKMHRHPEMSWDAFNQRMPGEFWSEAIQAVKRVNPNFVFIAETYWSMEGYLQKLGFDYTYNKPLYEAICSAVQGGHAEGLMNFLRLLGTDFLKRSVHFLENHDEERAMNSLGEDRQKAAAAMLCTLPGVALLHQGQMEGKRERMPVQRVIPLHQEPEHTGLHHFYRRLLKTTALPVFQEGRLTPLYSNNSSLASYARLDDSDKVLVIVNTSCRRQRGSVFLMPGLGLNSGSSYRLSDLFYEFKTNTAGTIQPFYVYPAAKLINQGLYVELEPYDAHIFMVESQSALRSPQRMLSSVRQTLEEWPLNRVMRRMLGSALTRSSDLPAETQAPCLAANPVGRQP